MDKVAATDRGLEVVVKEEEVREAVARVVVWVVEKAAAETEEEAHSGEGGGCEGRCGVGGASPPSFKERGPKPLRLAT